MQYSPKLKIAMEEIKAIIAKHDIAALVVLHTPGNSEYLNSISPDVMFEYLALDEVREIVTENVSKEKTKHFFAHCKNDKKSLAEAIKFFEKELKKLK